MTLIQASIQWTIFDPLCYSSSADTCHRTPTHTIVREIPSYSSFVPKKNKSLMYSFLERDVTDSGTLSAAATILHASQSAPNRPPARSRSIFFFIAFLWRRFVHSEEKRTEEYFSVRKARDYGVECSSLLHPLIPLHRAIAHGSSMPVTTNVNASNGKFVSFVHRLPIVFSRKCFKHPSSHIKSGWRREISGEFFASVFISIAITLHSSSIHLRPFTSHTHTQNHFCSAFASCAASAVIFSSSWGWERPMSWDD